MSAAHRFQPWLIPAKPMRTTIAATQRSTERGAASKRTVHSGLNTTIDAASAVRRAGDPIWCCTITMLSRAGCALCGSRVSQWVGFGTSRFSPVMLAFANERRKRTGKLGEAPGGRGGDELMLRRKPARCARSACCHARVAQGLVVS